MSSRSGHSLSLLHPTLVLVTSTLDSAKDRAVTVDSSLERVLTTQTVRGVTEKYWELLVQSGEGRPVWRDLWRMFMSIYKLLVPEIGESELNVAMERLGEERDPQETLTYWSLHKELVSLCDIWLPGNDSKDFASFLGRIFSRITLKVVLEPTGVERRVDPQLAAVILKTPGNPLFSGWSEVKEGESYSDLYVYRTIEDSKGQRKRAKKLKTDLMPEDNNSGKLQDDILYDEICLEDAENGGVVRYELQKLQDIVRIGEVAEAYLAHLKFKTESCGAENRPNTVLGLSRTSKDSTPVTIYGQIRMSSYPSSPESSDNEEIPIEFAQEGNISLDKANQAVSSVFISESVKEFLRDKLENGVVTLYKATTVQRDAGFEVTGGYWQSERMYDVQVTLMKSGGAGRKKRSGVETLRFLSLPRKRKNESSDLMSLFLDLLVKKYGKKKPKIAYRSPISPLSDVNLLEKFLHLHDFPDFSPFSPDGFYDIVKLSSKNPYKILIIGKTRAGKTTISQELSKLTGICHIDPEKIINSILKKSKLIQENEETDENPQLSLDFLEKTALNELLSGDFLSISTLISLLKVEISKFESQSRGFILDFPLINTEIIEFLVTLKDDFTHIIELISTNSDLKIRLNGVKMDGNTGKVYTKEDILREKEEKVGKKKERESESEEMEEEIEENEEEKVKIEEENLIWRPEDEFFWLEKKWHSYENFVLPRLREILPTTSLISVPVAGRTPQEIVEIIHVDLPEKAAVARRLNGGGEIRDLLMEDVKEDGAPRLLSPWRQFDPVALHSNQLLQGSSEFSAEFLSRVFVFHSESNLALFLSYPQLYLRTKPTLPEYRIAIIGPDGAGKRTQARLLSQKYGWKLVSAEDILEENIENMKNGDIKPSHPDSGFVQPSKPEFEGIMNGKDVKTSHILPVLMQKLGIQMQKRPVEVIPGEGEEEEIGEKLQKEDVGNSDAQSSEFHDEVSSPLPSHPFPPSEAQTTADSSSLPVYEDPKKDSPPVIYDDLPLNDIVRKLENDSDPSLGLGSFIFIGFPSTEEDLEALKYSQIEINRVISISVTDESIINRAMESVTWVAQTQDNHAKLLALVKEVYGEEKVVEVSGEGEVGEVHRRIVLALDPFTDRVDAAEVVGDTQDVGLTGGYDPVVLKNEAWLQPGNKDFKASFHGKEYVFCSDSERLQFELHPDLYSSAPTGLPHHPHLLLLGIRGSGVRTQAHLLSSTYQLPLLSLQTLYSHSILSHSKARKHLRYLIRGFRPDENYEETGNYAINEENDQEISEEDEEFDKNKHEIEVMRSILTDKTGIVIGNWENAGEIVSTPLVELLTQAKRLPEVVLILNLDDKSLIKRNIDLNAIEEEHEKAVKEVKEGILRRKEEFLANQDPDDPQEPPEEDENELISQLPTMEQRLEDAKAALLARKMEDLSKIEEIKSNFEEKGVKIEEINGEESIENVQKQVNYVLRPYIQHRSSLLKSANVKFVTCGEAQELLESGKVVLGEYGNSSPVSPYEYGKGEWPVVWRERLFYCRDGEERDRFRREIGEMEVRTRFDMVKALKPAVCILGTPHSGMSTLSSSLSAKYSLPVITPKAAITHVLQTVSSLSSRLSSALQSAQVLSDSLLTEVVLYRLNMADVRQNGFILCGFPRNVTQVKELCTSGVYLNPVIALLSPIPGLNDKFKSNSSVFAARIASFSSVLDTICYLETLGNSVFYLPSHKSKWFSLDFASDALNSVYKSKLLYLQRKNEPKNIENVGFPPLMVSRNRGKWRRLDPVAWKLKGVMEEVGEDRYVVVEKGEFVVFKQERGLEMYMKDAGSFLASASLLPAHRPHRLSLSECASVSGTDLQLEGHCVVCLKSGRLKQGTLHLMQAYQGKVYAFDGWEHSFKFAQMPDKFMSVTLPAKHVKKPTILTQISEFEAGISFLETRLSVSLMKSMLQTASLRPCFPGLSLKETALKHLSISLKSQNPSNSPHFHSKYTSKLHQFESICALQERFLSNGADRNTGVLSYDWEDEGFYRSAEELAEIEAAIQREGGKFFTKYIR